MNTFRDSVLAEIGMRIGTIPCDCFNCSEERSVWIQQCTHECEPTLDWACGECGVAYRKGVL